MIEDITKFVLEASQRLKVPLCLHYYPSYYQDDKFSIFSISIHGKYLLNFTTGNFYSVPKAMRMKELLPLIKVGLAHNMGERSLKDQIQVPRRQGKCLVNRGKRYASK
jgi:uncharacterized membrane protein YesL